MRRNLYNSEIKPIISIYNRKINIQQTILQIKNGRCMRSKNRGISYKYSDSCSKIKINNSVENNMKNVRERKNLKSEQKAIKSEIHL